MLRYMTGGESHGKCLVAIIDGIPAGVRLDTRAIDRELLRRMGGYGRGKRMSIENDRVTILSGVRKGVTIGSPVSLMIKNVDHSIDRLGVILEPRPGHADLAGALKYGHGDIRNVLERASARETAMRVASGAVAKVLLASFGIKVTSHVTSLGGIEASVDGLSFEDVTRRTRSSKLGCADRAAEALMCRDIDLAAADGDTVGGVVEVIAHGVPPGLGSYAQWDRRIDGAIARSMMSIPAVKGVSIGIGFDAATRRGSRVHDAISYDRHKGFHRATNSAGGIEGGVTNGEEIVVKVAMKPIATLMSPLPSVNIKTKRLAKASVQRSDTCAVTACGVVAEAALSLELAGALIEKLGGDSLIEMKRNFSGYMRQVRRY